MMRRRTAGIFCIFFAVLILSGCATTPDESYETDSYGYKRRSVATNLRYDDVPVPSNFSLVPSKSLAVESGTTRISSLHYRGRSSRIEIINFYKEYMENYGWNLINLIESTQAIMNYSNGEEICTIIMTGTGSDIELTISLSPEDE